MMLQHGASAGRLQEVQSQVVPHSEDKSVLVSGTHLGPATNFSFLFSVLTMAGFLLWGALSDERIGL
jgi:hypothetical protein